MAGTAMSKIVFLKKHLNYMELKKNEIYHR